MWLRQALAVARKEFLAILKDPRSRFLVIGPPLIQFFVFGYAATFDVTDVPYAVIDLDRTPASRDLLARFEGSHNFERVATLRGPDELRDAIDAGDVRLGIRIDQGFTEALLRGRTAEVQIIGDGRNSNVSGIALGYARTIVARWSQAWRSAASSTPTASVTVVQRAWYNPALISRWFIVSGLPVQLVLVVVILLTSLSVAREREQGTFDQALVAPLSATQILLGKATPPFVFGLVDGLLLTAGAVLWFGVPLTGTLPALVCLLAVYALAVIGVGLFISSLAATLQQGLLGAFLFTMPAVILSGFTTPIENMPAWLRAATLANPARHAVEACRAVMLEGADLAAIAGQLWPMLGIAGIALAASGWLFRARTG